MVNEKKRPGILKRVRRDTWDGLEGGKGMKKLCYSFRK